MCADAVRLVHRTLISAQKWLMGITTVVISILIFVQVFIRYFLDIPLYGVEEIATYLAVYLYFIGAGFGVYKGNHISASVMDLIIRNARLKAWFDLLVAGITAALFTWMLVICLDYFQWSLKRVPKSPELRLPLYYVHIAMVIGMGLASLYALIEVIRRALCAIKGHPYRSLSSIDYTSSNSTVSGTPS